MKQRYLKYLNDLNTRSKDGHQKYPIELSGFYASTRNNPLFKDHRDHDHITTFLSGQLRDLSSQYETPQTINTYKTHVTGLITIMESNFSDYFKDGIFKVSHAQKSLSVYLKYRWCQYNALPSPPACPIDSNVLCRLGWPYCKRRWTQMHLDSYNEILELLLRRAEEYQISIAEMELKWFDEMIITKK